MCRWFDPGLGHHFCLQDDKTFNTTAAHAVHAMRPIKHSRSFSLDAWPAFVDLLAATLLVMLFIFLIFIALEVHLTDSLTRQEQLTTHLNQDLEKLKKQAEKKEKALRRIESEKSTSEKKLGHTSAALAEAQKQLRITNHTLSRTKEERNQKEQLYHEALDNLHSMHLLRDELEKKLRLLTLSLSDTQNKLRTKNETIASLKQKLEDALYQRVKELEAYKSEFLAQLKKTLQGQPGFVISGDRFIFQSEILFPLGSDALQARGKNELKKLAHTLKVLLKKVPPEIPLILRIDGHTDILPLKNKARFQSNLDLSFARAKSVARFLSMHGIPEERLVPTGFAQHYPLDTQKTKRAFAKNRRIEFKLDQR